MRGDTRGQLVLPDVPETNSAACTAGQCERAWGRPTELAQYPVLLAAETGLAGVRASQV